MMKANRVLFMFVILAFLIFAGCGGGSPKGTVDEFIAAGKAGDMAKMKSLCTSDMLTMWAKMDEMSKKAGNEKTVADEFTKATIVKVEDESIEGDTAKVNAVIDEVTITFVLAKTGGKWLINDMITAGMSISDAIKQLEKVDEMMKGAPGGFGLPGIPDMPKGDKGE